MIFAYIAYDPYYFDQGLNTPSHYHHHQQPPSLSTSNASLEPTTTVPVTNSSAFASMYAATSPTTPNGTGNGQYNQAMYTPYGYGAAAAAAAAVATVDDMHHPLSRPSTMYTQQQQQQQNEQPAITTPPSSSPTMNWTPSATASTATGDTHDLQQHRDSMDVPLALSHQPAPLQQQRQQQPADGTSSQPPPSPTYSNQSSHHHMNLLDSNKPSATAYNPSSTSDKTMEVDTTVSIKQETQDDEHKDNVANNDVAAAAAAGLTNHNTDAFNWSTVL